MLLVISRASENHRIYRKASSFYIEQMLLLLAYMLYAFPTKFQKIYYTRMFYLSLVLHTGTKTKCGGVQVHDLYNS